MKYKNGSTEGEYHFIDDAGNKTASFNKKNSPGRFAEMQAWIKEGNEIEPKFTAEELVEKEVADKIHALEAQKQTCQTLLDNSDKRMVSDWPYPDDKAKNENYRKELRFVMGSSDIQKIPTDPFG